jgi:hypothetical protein
MATLMAPPSQIGDKKITREIVGRSLDLSVAAL